MVRYIIIIIYHFFGTFFCKLQMLALTATSINVCIKFD